MTEIPWRRQISDEVEIEMMKEEWKCEHYQAV